MVYCCSNKSAYGIGSNKAGNERAKIILVTAFEAFGGEELNPTEMVLERLPDTVGGYSLEKLLLPVEFVRCREIAFAKYDEVSPAAVIMLGQAGGRSTVTTETVGKNVMDSRIPDNAGYAPDRLPVIENGPEKLLSTLPVDRICEAVRALGIPCEASGDAGEYVCNTLLYGMLAHDRGTVPSGFIHVPYVREQGHKDKPYMELGEIVKGIKAAIEAVTRELEI